ncbi:MAG: rod shape-determining protein MreC [Candidatus Binatia bacterium]|nr:rod shape-determining protein MreC [Candidatus Binatia bacterium]
MLTFFRQNQVILSSFLCLLLSLYILSAASMGRLQTDPIGPLLMEMMRPLQRGLHAVFVSLRKVSLGYRTVKGLWLANQEFKRRIQEMEAERDLLLEAEATSRRLEKILDLKNRVARSSIAATVIGNSASTWFRSLTVNKGSRDGIHRGMAVISPAGAVGRVVSVASGSAQVLLVTDHKGGVDVLDQRTRVRGVVSGSLGGGPVMKYVGRNVRVREGDRLITSGLDGVFPKGLLVGTISRVRKETSGLFRFVAVKMAVDMSRIEEVLVVSPESPAL